MTHAAVALGLGRALASSHRRPWWFWALAAGAAAVPDLDVLAWPLGVSYGSMWAHRGITHSLPAALLGGALLAALTHRRLGVPPARLGVYFFVVIASHGVLDAFTNGGWGIAFFAPFDDTRYFFPWRPVEVSPIGRRFFGARGIETLESELGWIWLPVGAVLAVIELARYARARRR